LYAFILAGIIGQHAAQDLTLCHFMCTELQNICICNHYTMVTLRVCDCQPMTLCKCQWWLWSLDLAIVEINWSKWGGERSGDYVIIMSLIIGRWSLDLSQHVYPSLMLPKPTQRVLCTCSHKIILLFDFC